MAVGIGEVAGVAAPGRLLGGLRDRGAGTLRLVQHAIDLVARSRVVGQRDAGKAAALGGQLRVRRQRLARPQGEYHAAGLEEHHLGMGAVAAPAERLVEVP
jgi:hypothetical protein